MTEMTEFLAKGYAQVRGEPEEPISWHGADISKLTVEDACQFINNAFWDGDEQVGGDHYKKMKLQPGPFCEINGLSAYESNAVKYVCRWRSKEGLKDLLKAEQYIKGLIKIAKSEGYE